MNDISHGRQHAADSEDVSVQRIMAQLRSVETLRHIHGARLTQAAIDLSNAELAVTLTKARLARAERRRKAPREPLAWIESLFFLVPMLIVASLILWARANGWLK